MAMSIVMLQVRRLTLLPKQFFFAKAGANSGYALASLWLTPTTLTLLLVTANSLG